MAYISNAFVF